MALTTRTNKGNKLSITEMDDNLAYLVKTLSGSSQITGSMQAENCIASGSTQWVAGAYNTKGDNSSPFIVGRGTADNARLDAFKVTQSGSILVRNTQSAAPSWTGTDGEIIPVTIAGTPYLYMSMGGAWTSRSFA